MIRQTAILSHRLFDELVATPVTLISGLVFTPVFLLVQHGVFGQSGGLQREAGGDYLAFIVPGGVLMATVVAGAAGFAVTRDKEDRYVERLLTMPVARTAIVLAPILFGALYGLANVAIVLAVAAALGASPATGLGGAALILVIGGLWSIGVAGYMVATALVTRSIEIVQRVDVAFFAALFVSTAFVPRDALGPWVGTIADLNPVRYAIDGVRSLFLHGWEPQRIAVALGVSVAFAYVSVVAAIVATWFSAQRT
jgi:ABC-2 type transport system permease protein